MLFRSITATVSANTTAGFSIVTYTGTGANATVGHGLGVVPKLIIVKDRTAASTNNWAVYDANLANTDYLLLNTADAKATDATMWNSTTPTSSVFSVGTNNAVNQSTHTYVAYCFAEVPGFSKIGNYAGNSAADGPFIYCGFRPKWVLIKCSSAAGTNWFLQDAARPGYNLTNVSLGPNSSAAELGAYGDIDILATGAGASLMDHFVAYPLVERVLGHGETKSSVLVRGGFQVDLRLVDEASRGAAMQYFTGSKAHNIALREDRKSTRLNSSH